MKQQLKIAVIGVGHLGKHHVEHFCSIKNIVLVGVYDIDKVRAEKIYDKYDKLFDAFLKFMLYSMFMPIIAHIAYFLPEITGVCRFATPPVRDLPQNL